LTNVVNIYFQGTGGGRAYSVMIRITAAGWSSISTRSAPGRRKEGSGYRKEKPESPEISRRLRAASHFCFDVARRHVFPASVRGPLAPAGRQDEGMNSGNVIQSAPTKKAPCADQAPGA
jgi:hypothetical protein